MAKRKLPAPKQKVYPKSFETFHELGDWQIRDMTKESPSSFNGYVRIKKYRITIEEIEEPIEVLQARVQHFWDYCDNMHQWDPLKIQAIKLNYNLVGNPGNKVQRG